MNEIFGALAVLNDCFFGFLLKVKTVATALQNMTALKTLLLLILIMFPVLLGNLQGAYFSSLYF